MNKSISKISCFVIFIAFLMSMRCWIGFEGRSTVFFYALPFLLLLLKFSGKLCFFIQRRAAIFALMLYMVRVYFSYKATGSIRLNGIINQAFLPISVLMILSIVETQKEELLQYIVKWLGYILIVGIAIHLITSFVHLPSVGIIKTHYGGDFYGQDCYNYLFCIKPVTAAHNGLSRFSGPFIEPGDLGCVCSFLLYTATFNFRRYKNLKYILLAIFVSLSLGGYILTAVAFAFCMLAQNRWSGKYIFGGVGVILSIYLFGLYYNGGDNIINTAILSRIQETEMSAEATNGRTTTIKMAYYLDMWNHPDILLTGYDANTVSYMNEEGNGVGSGFTNIVIEGGLLGLLGMLLPYFYLSITSKNKRYSLLLFALLLVLINNRCDLFWLAYILSYSYGILLNEHGQKTYIQ